MRIDGVLGDRDAAPPKARCPSCFYRHDVTAEEYPNCGATGCGWCTGDGAEPRDEADTEVLRRLGQVIDRAQNSLTPDDKEVHGALLTAQRQVKEATDRARAIRGGQTDDA